MIFDPKELVEIAKVSGELVNFIRFAGGRSATKYLSPVLVVKATRHGKPCKNERSTSMVVTVGKPNYAEREFIKKCKKAGEPFPVKKIQLKWPSARRTK